MPQKQPAPFEIVEREDGQRIASNGAQRIVLLDADGRMFRRRGVKGIATANAADVLLPKVNEFAGQLLAHPEMPAEEAVNRLRAIAGLVRTEPPQRVEWLVVEIDGVRVYCDGDNVIVTRQDLVP
jgi:hypothetical protein